MDKNNQNYKILSIFFIVLNIVLVILIVNNINNEELNNNQNNNTNNNENKMDKNNSNPVVLFETNYGNFKAEIFLKESPITAGNFLDLVDKGFYNGIKFHRVIADFMIQGGDPLSKNDSLKNRWGTGDPGYSIEDEFIKGLSNVRGTLSMANSGPSSGGSQFFINTVNNTPLDWDKQPSTSKHPVFGKIIEGMDVVDKISYVKTIKPYDRPESNVVIEKVTILN